jgi:hypothetical protein
MFRIESPDFLDDFPKRFFVKNVSPKIGIRALHPGDRARVIHWKRLPKPPQLVLPPGRYRLRYCYIRDS